VFDSANDAQRACFDKILPWLQELPHGLTLDPDARNPTVYVAYGSACALVEVLPWHDGDTIIHTRSYVVTQVQLVPGLMEYLLRENDRLLFGAFGIDEDGDVFLNHAIVGSECDRAELLTSVNAILTLADDYDDAIVSRWGGRRAVDRALDAAPLA